MDILEPWNVARYCTYRCVTHCRPMDRFLTWPSLSLGMGWVHLPFHFDNGRHLTLYPKEKPAAELITATGYGRLGGFTLFQVRLTFFCIVIINHILDFQKDLPTRMKKKVHVVGGARGVWSLPIRQTARSNAASSRSHAAMQQDMDSVLVSTDAIPSPGLTRVRRFSRAAWK